MAAPDILAPSHHSPQSFGLPADVPPPAPNTGGCCMFDRTTSAWDAQENAIDSAFSAMRAEDSCRRWRLAAVLTWALIGAAALGWVWSVWLVRP